MPQRSAHMLVSLLESRPVVEFENLRAALGGASDSTVFRHLRRVSYRSSYSHNGRYYTLHDPSKYDRWGLYSVAGVHFSSDGTLKATVVRLVREAEAGRTQRELQELLRVRVQLFLGAAVREGAIAREQIGRLYLYLHVDSQVRESQLKRRKEMADETTGETVEVDAEVAIRVLLVLLRYPGSQPSDVVRRLKGRLPPVSRSQVDHVFARYGLGEKRGPSIF